MGNCVLCRNLYWSASGQYDLLMKHFTSEKNQKNLKNLGHLSDTLGCMVIAEVPNLCDQKVEKGVLSKVDLTTNEYNTTRR